MRLILEVWRYVIICYIISNAWCVEAETKWMPFCFNHICYMQILDLFNYITIEISFPGLNPDYSWFLTMKWLLAFEAEKWNTPPRLWLSVSNACVIHLYVYLKEYHVFIGWFSLVSPDNSSLNGQKLMLKKIDHFSCFQISMASFWFWIIQRFSCTANSFDYKKSTKMGV